jgi:hypothetical protein
MGKGDDDKKVMGREELLFPVLEPFSLAQTPTFRTVAVATGVVGDAGESAVLVTDIDVSLKVAVRHRVISAMAFLCSRDRG